MGMEHLLARAFQMSPEVWARHANPWSVWTRYAALPCFIIAVWSRVWIGWWSAPLTFGILIWIYINPRVFARPNSTRNWASKAVIGERVWLNRKEIPIAKHHVDAIRILNITTALGGVILLYGLIALDGLTTSVGTCIVVMGKSWFLDRMVWLCDDVVEEQPAYRSWLY